MSISNTQLFEHGTAKDVLDFAISVMGQEHAHKIETGIHPDLTLFHPEGKINLHPIEAMRRLIHEVNMAPFEARCKVFVIFEAEKMQAPSANALLKTLEEPSAHSYILLLTDDSKALLPTILSRCQKRTFIPQTAEGKNGLLQEIFEIQDYPSLRVALEKLEASLEESRDYDPLFEQILRHYADPKIVPYVEKTRTALQRSMRLRTAFEYLFLNISDYARR